MFKFNLNLEMATREIKNVLVLGTENVKISHFCKLFEAYLLYDSYDNAIKFQPKFNQIEAINRLTILVDNLKLICTSEGSLISKQIISMFSNFQDKQSLNAIIILINQNPKDNIQLLKLKSFLSHVLQLVPGNILYICELKNAACQSQETTKKQLNILGAEPKDNVFFLNENTFYKGSSDNWSAGVDFCNSINNYINRDGDKISLKTIYIKNDISTRLLLNLINNLMELLIQIYICNNVRCNEIVNNVFAACSLNIIEYKRNVTTCYGESCFETLEYSEDGVYKLAYIKKPNICHASCNCVQANRDVTECIIFETPNRTCLQCNHGPEYHSQNYFKIQSSELINVKKESQILLEVLAIFSVFKSQNQETFDFNDIFRKFLKLERAGAKDIFDTFNKEINQEVKLFEKRMVTSKEILTNMMNLYQLKKSGKIIPKFIEELFPEMRLEIRFVEIKGNVQSSESNFKMMSDIDDKIQKLADEVAEMAELKRMMEIIFNSSKDHVTIENPNVQDELSGTINLDTKGMVTEEKEINWNIDS